MNKINLAEQISKKIIIDDRKICKTNSEIKFYERLNSRILSLKGIKLSLLVNSIKLCIIKKDHKELLQYLMAITNSMKYSISLLDDVTIDEEIPIYIINIFVYYYLSINRQDLALDILKRRKIKEILINFNNNC